MNGDAVRTEDSGDSGAPYLYCTGLDAFCWTPLVYKFYKDSFVSAVRLSQLPAKNAAPPKVVPCVMHVLDIALHFLWSEFHHLHEDVEQCLMQMV